MRTQCQDTRPVGRDALCELGGHYASMAASPYDLTTCPLETVQNRSDFVTRSVIRFVQDRSVRICRELVSKNYVKLLSRHGVFDGALVDLPVKADTSEPERCTFRDSFPDPKKTASKACTSEGDRDNHPPDGRHDHREHSDLEQPEMARGIHTIRVCDPREVLADLEEGHDSTDTAGCQRGRRVAHIAEDGLLTSDLDTGP